MQPEVGKIAKNFIYLLLRFLRQNSGHQRRGRLSSRWALLVDLDEADQLIHFEIDRIDGTHPYATSKSLFLTKNLVRGVRRRLRVVA